MEIFPNIRINIRTKPDDGINWFLFLIFTRFKRNFELGRKLIQFSLQRERFSFREIDLEILKFKLNSSRDIIILHLLKQRPYCVQLWHQIFMDKVLLKERIVVLRSALLFIPKNKYFFNFIKVLFGIETMTKKDDIFFKKIFLFWIHYISSPNSTFNRKKNELLFQKIFKMIPIKTLTLKLLHNSTWLKRMSKSLFYEIYFSTKSSHFFVEKSRGFRIFLSSFESFFSTIFQYFKILKFTKTTEKNIILRCIKFSIKCCIKKRLFYFKKNFNLIDTKKFHTPNIIQKIFFDHNKFKISNKLKIKLHYTNIPHKKKTFGRIFLSKIKINRIDAIKKKGLEKLLFYYIFPSIHPIFFRLFPFSSKIGLMEKNKEIFDFENISNKKELTFNFNFTKSSFVLISKIMND